MKIDEFSARTRRVEGLLPGASTAASAEAATVRGDLAFFELFASLGGVSASKGEKGAPETADAAKLPEKPATPTIELSKTLPVKARAADGSEKSGEISKDGAADAVSGLKEADWLEADLNPADQQILRDLSLSAVPIPGTIPFQTFFSQEASGALSYRGTSVSADLAQLIEKAHKTGRPIRIDLDGHSSVVLKLNNGKVSAEFLAADKSMAMYLRQHLAELRSRMEARNLPVGTLEYREGEDGSGGRSRQGFHGRKNPWTREDD